MAWRASIPGNGCGLLRRSWRRVARRSSACAWCADHRGARRGASRRRRRWWPSPWACSAPPRWPGARKPSARRASPPPPPTPSAWPTWCRMPRRRSRTSTATATSTPSSASNNGNTRLLPQHRQRDRARLRRPLHQPLRPGQRGGYGRADLRRHRRRRRPRRLHRQTSRQHDLLPQHRQRDGAGLRRPLHQPLRPRRRGGCRPRRPSPTSTATATSTPSSASIGGNTRLLPQHRQRAARRPSPPPRPIPSASPTWASERRPTFADIDGDGDLDAFIGERSATRSSSATPAARGAGVRRRVTNPFGLTERR